MNFPLKPLDKYNDKENDYRNKECIKRFGSMNTDLRSLTNKEYLKACKELADDNIILSTVEVVFYDVFGGNPKKYFEVMSILLKGDPVKKNHLNSEWFIGTSNDGYERIKDIFK